MDLNQIRQFLNSLNEFYMLSADMHDIELQPGENDVAREQNISQVHYIKRKIQDSAGNETNFDNSNRAKQIGRYLDQAERHPKVHSGKLLKKAKQLVQDHINRGGRVEL